MAKLVNAINCKMLENIKAQPTKELTYGFKSHSDHEYCSTQFANRDCGKDLCWVRFPRYLGKWLGSG